jgi:hypothetical protein
MQHLVEIPHLLSECQEFPVRPLYGTESEPVAWLRHLYPNAAILDKYNRPAFDSTEPSYDRKYAYSCLKRAVLDPLAEGQEPFENKLDILEGYGIAVAPRWHAVAEVDGVPSLLRISPHVPGTQLEEWFESTDVPTEAKTAAASSLTQKLSKYARDTYLKHLAGTEPTDNPFFFDVSKTDQYIVNQQGEPILVDTGEEHLRFGDNFEGAFTIFHVWLTTGGLYAYMDTTTHTQVTNDLEIIAKVEEEADLRMKVANHALEHLYDMTRSL